MPDPTPETLSSDDPSQPRSRSRAPRGLTGGSRATALAAALSLVLTGGVATAAYRAFRSSTSPATLIPASAFAVATFDLGMPGGQDEALRNFADHFPGSPTQTGSGSAVDRLLRAALHDSEDPHLDYDNDVKPWLGDHVAIAGWLDSDNKAHAEYLVEVTDESAARATLRKLDATSPDDPGVTFTNGYAVLSNTQAEVTQALTAAGKSSLADDPEFRGDTSRLPDGDPVVGWLDGPRLKTALASLLGPLSGDLFDSTGPLGGTGVFGFSAQSALEGRAAVGLRAGDNYVQLDLLQFGGTAPHVSSSSRLTDLPAGTIAALDLGDPSPVVDASVSLVKSFVGIGGDITTCSTPAMPQSYSGAINSSPGGCASIPSPDPLQAFTEATGLTLPGDVKTLLGDASVVSYGGLELGGLPQVAIRSHPIDLAAAQDVAQRFADRLAQTSSLQLIVDTAGDDLILATTSDYAKAVASKGALGDQAQAATALGDIPSQVAVAGYVDLSRIWPLAGDAIPAGVRHLKAIGFWSAVDGGVQHVQMRMVVG